MAKLWDRLRGRADAGDDPRAALHRLFAAYPTGQPRTDADLARFLALREERLAVVTGFLREHGVDAAPMLQDDAAGEAASRAVDAWLDASLPRRTFSPVSGDPEPNADERGFIAGHPVEDPPYHAFVADLGILEGEAVVRADPRFGWAVNRLREQADMREYGRICLIRPALPGTPSTDPEDADPEDADRATVIAIDQWMLGLCHRKMAPNGDGSGHVFGELAALARAGGFDPL